MEPSDIKVHTTFTRTDDRRNKKYENLCVLQVYVPAIENNRGSVELDFRPSQYFREKIKVHFPNAKVDSYAPLWSVIQVASIPADRPREIATDDEVRNLLPPDGFIQAAVALAYNQTQEKTDGLNENYLWMCQAAHLLDWLQGNIEAQAKKNVQFEERLQALCNEFKTDVAAITDAELAKAVQVARDDNEEHFCKEAVDYLQKYATKFIEAHTGSGLPNRFPHIKDTAIKWLIKEVGE